ncbi:MAG: cysteine synthase family protein [SAR324 cluster bacterium]|nr:cysteine synthase family protein [SAR324 cluster bacterium]
MKLLDMIGNTPLLDMSYLYENKPDVSLFAKAEWMNPGGSIKDRPVRRMLTEAVASGELTAEKIVLDSSSGNAGIAYAMIGAAMGFRVQIVIPGNASMERKNRLKAHGAELIETNPMKGYDEALRHVRLLYQENPEKYFFCDQYSNKNNWQAHYYETGVELIEQVKQPITHFVCGIGTGGSITGVGRRLRETYPDVTIIGIRPEVWPGIEGLKPLGSPGDIVPEIFDESLVNEWVDVTADEAKASCLRIARDGIFVGQSSGAYLAGTLKYISAMDSGVVVTLLCDLGERYFSTELWGVHRTSLNKR